MTVSADEADEADEADVLAAIARAGVIPVVTIDDPADAVPLATALAAGGLGCIEVTLRTPAGLDAISELTAAAGPVSPAGELIVGAGTVLSAADARAAIDAGARFVVSPGLDPDTVEAARSRDVAAIPGIATPTELMRARATGVGIVKLFPAAAIGGPALVAALAAIWPEVGIVPTGGVSADNAADFLSLASVVAVGGSWMAPRDAIATGDWDRIERLAAEAVALVDAAR